MLLGWGHRVEPESDLRVALVNGLMRLIFGVMRQHGTLINMQEKLGRSKVHPAHRALTGINERVHSGVMRGSYWHAFGMGPVDCGPPHTHAE
jgi:citrate synthase